MSPSWATVVEALWVSAGLLLVGLLFYRSHDRDLDLPASLALGEATADVEESWAGIYVGDQKIGYSVGRTGPRDGGILLQERTQLKLVLLGHPNNITLATDATTDDQGELSELLAQMRTEVGGLPVSLRAEGRRTGQGMEFRVTQAGKELTRLQLDEVPATPATIYRRVAARAPEVGETFSVPWFSPLALGQSSATISVLERGPAEDLDGRSVDSWLLRIEHSGQVLEARVGVQGQRLSEREVEGGLGMRIVVESPEDAVRKGWPPEGEDQVDLVALSSVPVTGGIPEGGRGLARLEIRIEGPEHASNLLAALHGERWDPETNTLTVVVPDPAEAPSYPLPSLDRELRPWLRSTALAPSSNPEIRRTAGDIVGDRLDATTAARLLASWVHTQIRKVPVAGVPSATEILDSRRGDCNEHTTLYTALARALGIPTRMIAGLVYSEDIFEDGAFYYHAWPEVWLGEGWVPIDPTLGQFPANATHVGLIEGELDRQLEIMGVIGRLELEVAEAP